MPGDFTSPTDPRRRVLRPSDDRVDETAAITALDRTLDSLSDDRTPRADAPADRSSLLAGTAVALRALDDARPPDPTFVAHLEEQLMSAVALDPTRPTRARPAPDVPNRARRWPDRPTTARRPFPTASRRRGLIEFVSLAALIAVVFAQAMGGGGNLAFWRQGAAPSPTSGPSLAAPGGDATPSATPLVADGAGEVAVERGNPGRTGVYDTTGPEELPALLWRYADPMGGPMDVLEPIVAGGSAYFPTLRGATFAVSPFTLPAGEGGFGSWLITSGDSVNVAFGNGLIYAASLLSADREHGAINDVPALVAYDQATAEERWRVEMDFAGGSSPVLAGDTLLVLANDALVALDAATGAERWRTPVATYGPYEHPVLRNPAVEGDTVVVNELTGGGEGSGVGGSLRAFDLASGAERWSLPSEGGYFGPAALSEGVAFATELTPVEGCCVDTRLWAVDTESGDVLWPTFGPEEETSRPLSAWSAPAVDGGNVYTLEQATADRGLDGMATPLVARDAHTGEVRWARDVGSHSGSDISVADGVLYYTLDDGTVYAASAADGSELWRIDTGDAFLGTPVPADGYLVVASRTAVYAFGSAADGADVPVDVSGLPPCDPPRPLLPTPPSGDTAHGLVPIEDNPLGYGVPTGGRMLLADVPTGEPADAATVAGIYATLRGLAACDRPGAELERAAFYSDDYFRRFAVVERRPGDTHSVYADLFPVGDLTVADLGAPYLLDDTRVAVLAFDPLGDRGTLLVFAEQDGSWLIDEVVEVGVSAEVWRQG